MLRIRVSQNRADQQHPHAPFVGGELQLGDHAASVVLMIDTGADFTLIDASKARIPAEIMRRGSKQAVRGVGGAWPARRFVDRASFMVVAEDSETRAEVGAKLSLPILDVAAPYAEVRGSELLEELRPVAPTDRRVAGPHPRIRACPPMVPLLGRDAFKANGLRLEWDPNADSWVFAPRPR